MTCHQWLTSGACANRILPTIWVHMCRVSRVSAQSATRNRGHSAGRVFSSVTTPPPIPDTVGTLALPPALLRAFPRRDRQTGAPAKPRADFLPGDAADTTPKWRDNTGM
ncbi:hypothetical protein Arub01_49130 [Actinomadura rubrobrunea]|uniref:Uncharacterized protein n=1 Tax=Actinomadura rubrobrunea TaxID=115335 RepID=A0A9W6Q122_9ACTN|nr:hypothetical protein Arub01_49130 [Actinomadura rubrobrunea]